MAGMGFVSSDAQCQSVPWASSHFLGSEKWQFPSGDMRWCRCAPLGTEYQNAVLGEPPGISQKLWGRDKGVLEGYFREARVVALGR